MLDKIREYINTYGKKRILGFALVIVVLAALALTVIIAQNKQTIRQRASELVSPPSPPFPDSSPTPIAGSSNRVFVTSTTYNGNLGGLAGADAKCQDRANAAKLGGTWKVWLSDSTSSAASRLTHANVPYKLAYYQFTNYPDYTLGTIAKNWEDLVDGNNLNTPIDFDEFGNNWAKYLVWSNTDSSGYGDSRPIIPGSGHCNNWTSASDSDSGRMGVLVSTSPDWTSDPIAKGKPCNASFMHLYCFEQAAVLSPTPTPTPVPLTSTPSAILNVTPTTVATKGTLTINWSGIPNPNLGDFMNFMTADGKNGIASHTYWIHNNCTWFTPTSGTPKSSASCTIDLSKETFNLSIPGPYSLILYSGTTPGVSTVIVKSNNFNIVNPTPPPIPPVCTACSADVNRDGIVNILDTTIVSRCFNKRISGKCINADAYKDGKINAIDLNCVQRNNLKKCPR